MYQTTIKIEGFVTVTSQNPVKAEDIVVYLEAKRQNNVLDVIETEITSKEVTTEVPC